MNQQLFTKLTLIVSLILSMIFILNCAGSNVKDVDPNESDEDIDFSSSDLKEIAKHMTESIMESAFYKEISSAPKEERPRFILAPKLENKTTQHIDGRGIIEKVRSKLINNAGLVFIDETAINDAMKQLELQNSDFFNNQKALKLGQLVGGRYLVRGTMRSIHKRTATQDKIYLVIRLWITDLQTVEIVWEDEKEFKRTKEKDSVTI